MAKLAVTHLEELVNTNGTNFYRIIGRIIGYNAGNGLLEIGSIYDKSTCLVYLTFESEDTKWTMLPTIEEGSVVQIHAVSFQVEEERGLKCESLELINLPRHLLESKEVIISYSALQ